MKSWSPGYEIIRTYVRFAFWLTHKRIVVKGRNLIPKGKPIIFAANHQNALMDPLALACTNPYQSVWLARADIFKSKPASRILKYLKLLPVYRIRDGKENLSNNEEIFAQVISLLENKQTIALFPEAAHSGKRQMLPHKKAIPRIALEAEEKNQFKLNLQIVPVGIFYSHYWAFNRSIIVEYGKPIGIDKYKDAYLDNPQKALLDMRDEIFLQLTPLILNIKSEASYEDYETMRLLLGREYTRKSSFSRNRGLRQLYAEKELIGKLEKLEVEDSKTFEQLSVGVKTYITETEKAGMTDSLVEKAGKMNWKILVLQLFTLLISLPVFLFGLVFNLLPFLVPGLILRRKVKDLAFLSTFNFVIGLIVFPVFYVLFALLVFAVTQSWIISAITFILMPFGGKLSYQLLEFYKDILDKVRILIMKTQARKQIKQLLTTREDLIQQFLEKLNFQSPLK